MATTPLDVKLHHGNHSNVIHVSMATKKEHAGGVQVVMLTLCYFWRWSELSYNMSQLRCLKGWWI